MTIRRKRLTLADCNCDGTPRCAHCDKELPRHTPIEVQPDYVIVRCAACGCMTPFARQKEATA